MNPGVIFNCIVCKKEKSAWPKKGENLRHCSRDCRYSSSQKRSNSIEELKIFFNKNVIKNDDCWAWNGSFLGDRGVLGYKGKKIVAPRASWLIHYGEIPEDKLVCHTCDNPICTNPEHLFLGTPSDNMQDMIKKDRSTSTKLDCEKINRIRSLIEEGIRVIMIAKEFSVSRAMIYRIKSQKSWWYI